jgi:hypothetical protein
MARNIHDRFTKEWLKQLLPDFGTVEIESQIMGKIRTIDVVFHPDQTAIDHLPDLGLLGKMLVNPCAIEAFRNPVPEYEVSNCGYKRFSLERDLVAIAKQKKQPLPKQDYPRLWVLTPTFSKTLKDDFNVETDPTWGPGIYFRCNAERTGIIAIHELPKTKDTILLRLLGKGAVQAEAIKELTNLPKDHPYLQETLRHISILQINLKLRHNKTKDIKEVIMNLSPAYEKWHEETLAEGRTEGVTIGEAQGRNLERISVARTMLQEGLSIALIKKVTGFSLTEIEQLGLETAE